MPLHDFRCEHGHVTECLVGHGVNWIYCPRCKYAKAGKVFLTPPMGFVQRDICYDSPVDGRPVTSKHAREEDLRRAGCIPYEPGMRQDVENRRRLDERALDASIEHTVEQAIAEMPVRKREVLEQELRAGASAEVKRDSPTPN